MAHTKVSGIAMLVTGFVVAGICGFAAGGFAGGFLQHGQSPSEWVRWLWIRPRAG